MQAEYYSEKAIAVLGDTKPWAANLKALGGKFNGNLRGRPGWIFQRAKEPELMQFIAQANAGQIQAAPQATYQATQPTMVPFGATQPAMTPQAAMMRLQLNQQPVQPMAPFPQITIPMGLPPIQPINVQRPASPLVPLPVNAPRPADPIVPHPVTVLPQQPAFVNYPNLFTAADGLQYQVILYTAPMPSVGQRVTLAIGGDQLEYSVSGIESTTSPIDSIFLTAVPADDAPADEEPAVSRAIIMKGQWKIHCMQDDHTLTFHPLI